MDRGCKKICLNGHLAGDCRRRAEMTAPKAPPSALIDGRLANSQKPEDRIDENGFLQRLQRLNAVAVCLRHNAARELHWRRGETSRRGLSCFDFPGNRSGVREDGAATMYRAPGAPPAGLRQPEGAPRDCRRAQSGVSAPLPIRVWKAGLTRFTIQIEDRMRQR